jgi:hypothetical protein
MSNLAFHPNTTLVEAARIALDQGCVLRARDGHIFMRRAKGENDKPAVAPATPPALNMALLRRLPSE